MSKGEKSASSVGQGACHQSPAQLYARGMCSPVPDHQPSSGSPSSPPQRLLPRGTAGRPAPMLLWHASQRCQQTARHSNTTCECSPSKNKQHHTYIYLLLVAHTCSLLMASESWSALTLQATSSCAVDEATCLAADISFSSLPCPCTMAFAASQRLWVAAATIRACGGHMWKK